MKVLNKIIGAAALVSLVGASQAMAFTTFNANVTNAVIFGTGNGNGFWTTETDFNVEVGLRGKVRGAGVYNSDGAGTYNHDTGISSGIAAKWNFEFSINVDQGGVSGKKISDYNVLLRIDTDPSEGQSWIEFDPFAVWSDNSFGDNTTAISSGTGAVDFIGQTSLMSTWNLAQNSQNLGWMGLGINVHADATYDFQLSAYDKTSGEGALTSMTVVVGAGGAPVPDTGSTAALLGVGIFFLGALKRFRKA